MMLLKLVNNAPENPISFIFVRKFQTQSFTFSKLFQPLNLVLSEIEL
jgi:hypothetical protein